MARPEDTLARGAGRNGGGFEPVYDDSLQGQRRVDPRLGTQAPMRSPNQTGIPLAPDPQREAPRDTQRAGGQPGVTPRFDPYLPQGNGAPPRQQVQEPAQIYTDPRQNGRQDPRLEFPPQGQQAYAQDPYQQQRAPQGAAPNGQRPPPQAAPQQLPPAAPPMAERRYAAPAPGERGAPVRPATQGRPGQTARPVANGYAPPAAAPQQEIVPPVRGRDPYQDGPTRRQALAPPNGAQMPARQPYGYAQDGYGEEAFADGAQTEAADDEFEADEDEDEYADEAAPRSRRGLYVLGALVIAIVVGGGLGLAYKMSMGPGVKDGATRVLQADKSPLKTVPADAGGQTFDKGTKTIMDRASDPADGQATMVTNSEAVATNAGGQTDAVAMPRKVKTMVVTPGQPISADAAPSAMDDQGVPGISLGEPDPAPQVKPAKVPDAAALKTKMKNAAVKTAGTVAQQASDAVDQTAAGDLAADAQAVAAEAAQQPTKLAGAAKAPATAKKLLKVAAVDPAADPAAADVPAEPPAATATKTKPVKDALATPAATPKATGGGYILQVFSGKSSAESLAYFADMQQKFPDLIGSGQPDIQEVDLGSQGKKYRLRIGPPGSSTAVRSLCTKLKASGLKDCITAAY